MNLKKIPLFLAVFFLVHASLIADEQAKDPWRNDFKYREYKSDCYLVRVEPIKDLKCLQGYYNIIRVSIYEYESQNFYYMHYLTGEDWEYTYNEYETNKDLKPRCEPFGGITRVTINWFASDCIFDVMDIKNGAHPEYYAEIEKTHYAYGWTVLDSMRIREESSK